MSKVRFCEQSGQTVMWDGWWLPLPPPSLPFPSPLSPASPTSADWKKAALPSLPNPGLNQPQLYPLCTTSCSLREEKVPSPSCPLFTFFHILHFQWITSPPTLSLIFCSWNHLTNPTLLLFDQSNRVAFAKPTHCWLGCNEENPVCGFHQIGGRKWSLRSDLGFNKDLTRWGDSCSGEGATGGWSTDMYWPGYWSTDMYKDKCSSVSCSSLPSISCTSSPFNYFRRLSSEPLFLFHKVSVHLFVEKVLSFNATCISLYTNAFLVTRFHWCKGVTRLLQKCN